MSLFSMISPLLAKKEKKTNVDYIKKVLAQPVWTASNLMPRIAFLYQAAGQCMVIFLALFATIIIFSAG